LGVIRANYNDRQLLARLMRAEAVGEGDLAMLLVGNVGVNRVKSNCLDFKKIRSIPQMVYQSPGGFESTQKGFFYQRVRDSQVRLAKKVINGNRFAPAEFSLWFYKPVGSCPATWYNQQNTGRFKSHCFFQPTGSACPGVYTTY